MPLSIPGKGDTIIKTDETMTKTDSNSGIYWHGLNSERLEHFQLTRTDTYGKTARCLLWNLIQNTTLKTNNWGKMEKREIKTRIENITDFLEI